VLGRVAVRNKDKEHELISSFLSPSRGQSWTRGNRNKQAPQPSRRWARRNELIDDGAQTGGRGRDDDEFPELDGLQAADRSSLELADYRGAEVDESSAAARNRSISDGLADDVHEHRHEPWENRC
jgi:hypothetical protein